MSRHACHLRFLGPTLGGMVAAVVFAAAAIAQTPSGGTDDDTAGERLATILEDGAIGERSTGVWAGFSLGFKDDDRPGEARDVDTYSVQLGIDHTVTIPQGQVLIGAFAGHHRADVLIRDGNARVDSEGWGGGIYGAYSPFLFLSFPFAAGVTAWHSDQTRDGTPSVPVYESEFDSLSVSTSVGAVLTLPVAPSLVASGGVRHIYSVNDRESYREDISGSGINFLETPSERSHFARVQGDLRLAYLFDEGRVWSGLGYARDLARTPDSNDRDQFPVSLGLDLDRGALSVSVSASTVLGREDVSQHTFSGRLRYRF